MKIFKMSCSEAVRSSEAVDGDEADKGLPVDSDAVQLVETPGQHILFIRGMLMPQSQCPRL